MATKFMIINVRSEEELYWSNEEGWVPKEDADIFNMPTHVHMFNNGNRPALLLPMEGEWVKLDT